MGGVGCGLVDACWQVVMDLPPGEYEYRYVVNGHERVDAGPRAVAACGQGVCNIWTVAARAPPAPAPETCSRLLCVR